MSKLIYILNGPNLNLLGKQPGGTTRRCESLLAKRRLGCQAGFNLFEVNW